MPLEFECAGAAAGLGGLRDVRVTDSQGSAHRPTGRRLGLTVCGVGGPPQGDRFEGETHGRKGAEAAPQPGRWPRFERPLRGEAAPLPRSRSRLLRPSLYLVAGGRMPAGRGEPEGSEE